MIATALAGHAPVDLAELNATAALQTRRDRKYVLTQEECQALLAGLDPATRVLEIDGGRDFAYESTYFDTPDLAAFHLAAGRRRRRFKVRTRTYVDSGACFVEVKTRAARGTTVKERQVHDDVAIRLGADGTFVDARLAEAGVAGPPARALVPTLRSSYRRSTLLLPDARVTLDTGLTWDLPAGSARARLGELVVVETKTGGPGPSSADRLLWRSGHRPDRISKYATGLALLRPGLPDAPWRRLIRHRLVTVAATTTVSTERTI